MNSEGEVRGIAKTIRMAGILDLSTIDFPGKLCSVLFLTGCPFRCPYCHNHPLIAARGEERGAEEIVRALRENYLVDGVCITGGEPTMQDITGLVRALKEAGLAVKLDTNGYYPPRLKDLLEWVDYVAIDVKTTPEKYGELTGRKDAWQRVEESLEILSESGVDWEARTTVVPGLVWREEVQRIGEILRHYEPVVYALQQFSNENPLDPQLKDVSPPTREELMEMARGVELRMEIRCREGTFRV